MVKNEISLPVRITVLDPPGGVTFRLQDGTMLIEPQFQSEDLIVFDFSIRLKDGDRSRKPRFVGRFVSGSPDDRFVYICSGTLAGQTDSCWTRRAKIKLTDLDWPLIDTVDLETGLQRLSVAFRGRARDGGPSCATVPLEGWTVIANEAAFSQRR